MDLALVEVLGKESLLYLILLSIRTNNIYLTSNNMFRFFVFGDKLIASLNRNDTRNAQESECIVSYSTLNYLTRFIKCIIYNTFLIKINGSNPHIGIT